MRIRIALLALVVACAFGAEIASAQLVQTTPVTPRVITGADIGFRIEGLRGNTPVGRFVVKVNDQWVEAAFADTFARPLSTR